MNEGILGICAILSVIVGFGQLNTDKVLLIFIDRQGLILRVNNKLNVGADNHLLNIFARSVQIAQKCMQGLKHSDRNIRDILKHAF